MTGQILTTINVTISGSFEGIAHTTGMKKPAKRALKKDYQLITIKFAPRQYHELLVQPQPECAPLNEDRAVSE